MVAGGQSLSGADRLDNFGACHEYREILRKAPCKSATRSPAQPVAAEGKMQDAALWKGCRTVPFHKWVLSAHWLAVKCDLIS